MPCTHKDVTTPFCPFCGERLIRRQMPSETAGDTETLDRLFLELSRITSATTRREFEMLSLLENIEAAAWPLIQDLLDVGNKTNWRDGDQTDRVYAMFEFRPLKELLDEYRAAKARGSL